MRRRLYNLFGLPELPEGEPVEDEIDVEPVIEELQRRNDSRYLAYHGAPLQVFRQVYRR